MVGIVDNGTFEGQLYLSADGPLFFDLQEGHRVTVAPVAARNDPTNGVVFFASFRLDVDLDVCAGGFDSTLTAIGATGGLGAYDMDPEYRRCSGTSGSRSGQGAGALSPRRALVRESEWRDRVSVRDPGAGWRYVSHASRRGLEPAASHRDIPDVAFLGEAGLPRFERPGRSQPRPLFLCSPHLVKRSGAPTQAVVPICYQW